MVPDNWGVILQSQLEEERRERMEMEARMMAKQMALLADNQRMTEMFQYMQSLGAAQSLAPPAPLFPTDDPAKFHSPVSMKF
jgi:hypothetical protein